jgi:hypothetical protein
VLSKIGARFLFYKEQKANETLSAFFNNFPASESLDATSFFSAGAVGGSESEPNCKVTLL